MSSKEQFLRKYMQYKIFLNKNNKCIIETPDPSGNEVQDAIKDKLTDLDKQMEIKSQMNIFQTWKSHKVPKIAHKPTITWKYFGKNWNYKLYDDKECFNFIRDNFNEHVLAVYQSLPFGVMKADFWRYCIIYKIGGLYTDLDTSCLIGPSQWIPQDAQLVISGEVQTPLFCQWTFFARRNNPIIKKVIDTVCSRIITGDLKHIRASMIHQLTGPQAFTAGVITGIKELAIKHKRNDLLPLISSLTIKNGWDIRVRRFLMEHKIYILPNGVFDGLYVQHHYGGSRWNYVGYTPWKKQLKSILQRKKV